LVLSVFFLRCVHNPPEHLLKLLCPAIYPSCHQNLCNNLRMSKRIFIKPDILEFYKKKSCHFSVAWNQPTLMNTLHEALHAFLFSCWWYHRGSNQHFTFTSMNGQGISQLGLVYQFSFWKVQVWSNHCH
jgi:hypothetical protein